MKLSIIFLLLLLLTSCDPHFNEKDLYGCYSSINFQNNYDSIQLKANGIYKRKVYDKNRKLVLEMSGMWHVERDDIIDFKSFYLNMDDDLVQFPESAKDTSFDLQALIKNKNGKIQICIQPYDKKYLYSKIK